MERLIEKIADAEAALTTPDGGRIECRVRELGEVSSGYDGFGTLRYYKSYLVAQCGGIPDPPGKLEVGGLEMDIASVKRFRSHSGEDLGYKVTVFSA